MAYGVNAPFGLRPISSITGGSWTEKVNEYYIYASADGTTTYGTSIFTDDPVVFTPTRADIAVNPYGFITRYLPAFSDGTPSTFSALPLLGTFQGCQYTLPNGTLIKSPYWAGGTVVQAGSTIKCWVLDDPNVVFDVQVSTHVNGTGNAFVGTPTFPNLSANTSNGTVKAGSFGSNFALNVGGGDFSSGPINPATGLRYPSNPATGNTLTGQSAFYLDVITITGGDAAHDYGKAVATLPLKAIGWTQNPQNIAAPGQTMSTTPFLNVRVIINNHVYGHNTAGTTLA